MTNTEIDTTSEYPAHKIAGHRFFVEQTNAHNIECKHLFSILKDLVLVENLVGLRISVFYEVYGLNEDQIMDNASGIFFEAPRSKLHKSFEDFHTQIIFRNTSLVSEEYELEYSGYCATEYLPGQYDQRAEAAEQCLALLGFENITVRTGQVLLLYGHQTNKLTKKDLNLISQQIINPIEMREKDLHIPPTITPHKEAKYYNTSIEGFLQMDSAALETLSESLKLSMSIEDLHCIFEYFTHEKRAPTLSEIRILDTYWSDHCRHTTFLTELTKISVPNHSAEQRALELFHSLRHNLQREHKPVSLIEMATIAASALIADGEMQDIDISEEVNACSVKIPVQFDDGTTEQWLLMFKNETHNHPTEIEPFGGASTCLGGAIRDPLSGRAYVFGGMRISGSADPRTHIFDTLDNKLPQLYITQQAAKGFSSYGNQVGIPNCYVKEIYHSGYEAKRLEAGFVIAAVPQENVRREVPQAGDRILLVGGNTGRDGIGGAVGSSKTHTKTSLTECNAEVQKGNATEARALQRLFRKKQVSQLIKRCNDFGAGGVSVAVGELADGVCIYLDKIPVKYRGLNGTELAISESQERMAVVLDKEDVALFIELAHKENIVATEIAEVSAKPYMEMWWRNHCIAKINREFLNTHGAKRTVTVNISECNTDSSNTLQNISSSLQTAHGSMHTSSTSPYTINFVPNKNFSTASIIHANIVDEPPFTQSELNTLVIEKLKQINFANQQGLQEQFDSSIGAGTVLLPYGGYTQESQSEGLAVLIPTSAYQLENIQSNSFNKETRTGSIKSCQTVALATLSCPIDMLAHSPFHGASYAVVNSLAKIVAMGGNLAQAKLSFQEYFRRLHQDPSLWAAPCSALLGALEAQMHLRVPAIGGKDSMSGSFEHLHVPPTFISFAVSTTHITNIKSVELSNVGAHLYLLPHLPSRRDNTSSPNYSQLLAIWNWYLQNLDKVQSAISIDENGLLFALIKMCIGNNLGIIGTLAYDLFCADFFYNNPEELLKDTLQGSILFSSKEELSLPNNLQAIYIGESTSQPEIKLDISFPNTEHITEFSLLLDEYRLICLDTLHSVFLREYDILTDITNSQFFSYHREEDNINFSALNKLFSSTQSTTKASLISPKQPQVCIPIFPGTNCEDDTAVCFELFGASTTLPIFLNRTQQDITNSIIKLAETIRSSQILVIAGGFSLNDQPEGAGKYIANVLRHPQIVEAIFNLLDRDGLILGVCNGFQALIKSGWLPFGQPQLQGKNDATLTTNATDSHISFMGHVKVCENQSPWLSLWKKDQSLLLPFSHGEGNFVASNKILTQLNQNKQIATKYASEASNPNGSMRNIEGITSIDGKIFGRMGHAERIRPQILKNFPDIVSLSKLLKLKSLEGGLASPLYDSLAMFKAGVEYFV